MEAGGVEFMACVSSVILTNVVAIVCTVMAMRLPLDGPSR